LIGKTLSHFQITATLSPAEVLTMIADQG